MVLPSLKQVCRLSESLFNKLAVARGKPTITVSKTQHLGPIHSKQFLYKQNLKQFNFIHLFCEACNGAKLSLLHRSMIDVNKWPNELYLLESKTVLSTVKTSRTNTIYAVVTSIR